MPFSTNRHKKSLSIHGHKTSLSLEAEFWSIIEAAAASSDTPLSRFITDLDDQRMASGSQYGLAAYLRVWSVHQIRQNQK